MTTILKLGGSVVTEKDHPETLDDPALDRVVATIADHLDARHRPDSVDSGDNESGTVDELVVVHGGGSFGHHHAAEHGVSTTDGTDDAAAIAAIHDAMVSLNGAVVDSMQSHAIRALPVSPLSLASRDEGGELSLPPAPVERMLGEGFVPVLHGDVITHEGKGGTILSGDEIVRSLATSLSADRVGLCSTVPGVLDDDGTVVSEIDSYEAVAAVLGESETTDVTGGMAGKVRAMLELGPPAAIFDPDALGAFLRGERVGTVIDG